MAKTKNEFSGTIAPRRDIKAIRKYRKGLRGMPDIGKNPLNPKGMSHLAHVIEASKNAGTFNKKDAAALGRLIQRIHKESPIDHPNQIRAFRRLNSLNDIPTNLANEPGHGGPGTSPMSKRNNKKNDRKDLGDKFVNFYKDATKGHGHDRFDTHYKGPKKKNHGKGKGHKGKGHGGRRGGRGPSTSTPGMLYYGLGQFPGVSRKEAKTVVGNEINQQVRELLDQAQSLRKAREFDVNQINSLFGRTQGDLNYVYGEAQDAIQGQNQKINKRYEQTGNTLEDLFKSLQQTQAQNTDSNRDAAMSELARLGIQQTGMGRYDQDANFAQTMANQGQTNSMANLEAMQSGSAEIGNLLNSMSQAALASAVGRATNNRQDSITETRQGYRENLNSLMDAIKGVRSQRGQMTNELFSAMEGNAYNRWMESQQADFNNQLAANQFNLDVSKLNSDNWLAKAQMRRDAAEAKAKRRRQQEYESMLNQGKALDKDLAKALGY